ncbi:MAG: hypothetical protein GY719_25715 [bacterium]|nr:hypothetical protein [bacterium]
MNYLDLLAAVDPPAAAEMRKRFAPNPRPAGRAIVIGQGKQEDGRNLSLVVMCVATDEDLGDLATYAARVEIELTSREDRPDLQGVGVAGIITNESVFKTD